MVSINYSNRRAQSFFIIRGMSNILPWLLAAVMLCAQPAGAAPRHALDETSEDRWEPNDPLYSSAQWNLRAIRMPEAWQRLQTLRLKGVSRRRIVVAVLDTGLVLGHPDIDPGRLLSGYDFISDPGQSGDGDGRDGNPEDVSVTLSTRGSHGLHLTGMIAATLNNSRGIAGIDDSCWILPVRVIGSGKGSEHDVADAVRWAAGLPVDGAPANANPAQIVNLSFEGDGDSSVLQRAIDEVVSLGVVVIAAAGNQGRDAAQTYPAKFDHVITVGAVGYNLGLATYSNRGQRLDLLAPGGDEVSQWPGVTASVMSTTYQPSSPAADRYGYFAWHGTSQAAAQVSAATALALSLNRLSPVQVATLLHQSANERYRCAEDGCGTGLLDVDKLIKLASGQNGCTCGDGQLCVDGQCIVADWGKASSGCEFTQRSTAVQSSGWALLLAAVILMLSRRCHCYLFRSPAP